MEQKILSLIKELEKENFESWLKKIDDDLFTEVYERINKDCSLNELNKLYNTDNYKQVIDLFKDTTKKIIIEKIIKLSLLLPC